MEPRWEEADDELREGYAVEHLLDQFIVTADYKKQTDCDWNVAPSSTSSRVRGTWLRRTPGSRTISATTRSLNESGEAMKPCCF